MEPAEASKYVPEFSNLLPALRDFLEEIDELESRGADLRGKIEHLLESFSGEAEIAEIWDQYTAGVNTADLSNF